jgi:hypothetical protein
VRILSQKPWFRNYPYFETRIVKGRLRMCCAHVWYVVRKVGRMEWKLSNKSIVYIVTIQGYGAIYRHGRKLLLVLKPWMSLAWSVVTPWCWQPTNKSLPYGPTSDWGWLARRPVCRVATNVLNKQSRTADKGWPRSLVEVVTTPHGKKLMCCG